MFLVSLFVSSRYSSRLALVGFWHVYNSYCFGPLLCFFFRYDLLLSSFTSLIYYIYGEVVPTNFTWSHPFLSWVFSLHGLACNSSSPTLFTASAFHKRAFFSLSFGFSSEAQGIKITEDSFVVPVQAMHGKPSSIWYQPHQVLSLQLHLNSFFSIAIVKSCMYVAD